ncbi:ferrous iron transport protein B [Acetatifactor muris]|uniref:Ferrous iron transport protein B n=1 Tax=Acetatifactor muris TaxID=879566 RepID=A0A2K4ZJP3_9FIRM|nr:ferrous iron transport protein B [Acetatifactor muris]MCR2048971.1 ferrous iron transport protein B [Acetatifactor muris]SOY30680.1 Ferrous iron transport protein B [Acetatifactor muris]
MNRNTNDKVKRQINVACIGNPNCGKTTLFNALTGSRLKVANWPGVTVERVEGTTSYEDAEITLIDTPGIYSLTCYTIEEKVTRQCAMDDDIDAIINVVDASSLERNLYLTLQLLELGKPIVLALNMMDVVEERGMELDMHRLPEMLGDIPVVPVSAARRTGLDILLHAVIHHCEEGMEDYILDYPPEIEEKITTLETMMQENYPSHSSARWHAIKLLEDDEEVKKEHPISVVHVVDRSYEKEIIQCKYTYIEKVVKEILFYKNKKAASTDRIDRLLTHPVWGIPIFLLIMCFVFFLTFTVGDILKGAFEIGLDSVSGGAAVLLESLKVTDWLKSLMVDGIITGVGGILTFIPNIFILFLALAILEDSGYMARVAYVMDSVMGKVGLSGKAFLPMILGFGCTVPAIMAARALETEHDRRRTMLVTPFMSCSARLPVYVLLSDMFFPNTAALTAFSMYVAGMVTAILAALVANRLEKGKINDSLLIELPEYKRPNARTIRIYVWNKLKDYLTKAGTTIFIASIVIWFVLNFGITGIVENPADSFGAMLGRVLVPVLAPAGLGMWQIAVALLSGISAKEVVVSSFSVLFGVANANSDTGVAAIVENIHKINPAFGPLNAYCLMLFCLLYVPCVATVATIKKESGSWKFTGKMIVFQIVLAWAVSTVVFQAGSLLTG